jgi:hypothetical protein
MKHLKNDDASYMHCKLSLGWLHSSFGLTFTLVLAGNMFVCSTDRFYSRGLAWQSKSKSQAEYFAREREKDLMRPHQRPITKALASGTGGRSTTTTVTAAITTPIPTITMPRATAVMIKATAHDDQKKRSKPQKQQSEAAKPSVDPIALMRYNECTLNFLFYLHICLTCHNNIGPCISVRFNASNNVRNG